MEELFWSWVLKGLAGLVLAPILIPIVAVLLIVGLVIEYGREMFAVLE